MRAAVEFEQSFDRFTEHVKLRPNQYHPLNKHKPMKGGMALGYYDGRPLPRWEWDLGSAARIWVLVDEDRKAVYVDAIRFGHPRETEPGRKNRRR